MRWRRTGALAAALIAGIALEAQAGPIAVFDSTAESAAATRSIVALGPLGGSFTTPGFAGSIASITLDLACNGTGKCGAAGTYAAGVKTIAGSSGNVLTLSSVSAYAVGDLVSGTGIAPGTVYITAVDTTNKTITLSSAVTVSTGTKINYLKLGGFTLSLDSNTGSSAIPGAVTRIADIPGTSIAQMSIYDAQLVVANSLVETAPTLFTFSDPFGSATLSPGTSYWITLTNLAPMIRSAPK